MDPLTYSNSTKKGADPDVRKEAGRIALLKRLLARQSEKYFTKRSLTTAYALSIADPDLTSKVWELLSKQWGDESGNPFLPQPYHLDGCDRVEKSWSIVTAAVGDVQSDEEICTIRHADGNLRQDDAPVFPTLAEEKVHSLDRRLLRVTHAGAAAVQKGSVRRALQSMLSSSSDPSVYIRLVRLTWPLPHGGGCTTKETSGEAPPTARSLLEPGPSALRPFTFCELFAGLGGFRIALQALGGTCVFASELDPVVQAVYAGRWDERAPDLAPSEEAAARGKPPAPKSNPLGPGKLHGDITQIPSSQIPAHDLLVGGFPCQPFSRLGLQGGFEDKTERGTLYLEILRILKDKRPKMFLLENVPGITDPMLNEGAGAEVSPLEVIVQDLKLGGAYDVDWRCYSSAPLTPQIRRRVYIVGVLREVGGEEGKRKKKRRGIVFPDRILPDLGLLAEDAIRFDEAAAPFAGGDEGGGGKGGGGGGGEKGGGDATCHAFQTNQCSRGAACRFEHRLATAAERRRAAEDRRRRDARTLRLSPQQFGTLARKLPALQREGKAVFLWPDSKVAPVVSHYGHTPQHGKCQMVARPSSSEEGGVPRVLSREECLRVMGMNPRDFLPEMETEWIGRAPCFAGWGGASRLATKKAAYKMIGNAVCPPVIAWLVEKVVLPAGGFVKRRKKKGCGGDGDAEEEGGSRLPVYLRLALEAVRCDWEERAPTQQERKKIKKRKTKEMEAAAEAATEKEKPTPTQQERKKIKKTRTKEMEAAAEAATEKEKPTPTQQESKKIKKTRTKEMEAAAEAATEKEKPTKNEKRMKKMKSEAAEEEEGQPKKKKSKTKETKAIVDEEGEGPKKKKQKKKKAKKETEKVVEEKEGPKKKKKKKKTKKETEAVAEEEEKEKEGPKKKKKKKRVKKT